MRVTSKDITFLILIVQRIAYTFIYRKANVKLFISEVRYWKISFNLLLIEASQILYSATLLVSPNKNVISCVSILGLYV
jgi:hypothetical protein